MDKSEACRSHQEHRANPAISGLIVPFRWGRPWTNVGQVGARPLGRPATLGTARHIDCSSGAQGSCLMKRPAGPLGCQDILALDGPELAARVGVRRPDADMEKRQAGAAGRNRTCDPLLRREMLYPLSYSRAARQCSKGARMDRRGARGPRLAEAYEIAQVSGM